MSDKKLYTAKVTKIPNSQIEVLVEISWENFEKFENKAFSKLSERLEIDGFRKGNVPASIAKEKLGDELILADMAELAVQEFYPQIVTDEKLDVIGRPNLSITKLARGNSLEFKVTSSILPVVDLPDYKKIASGVKQEENKSITEEEVEKVIQDLRQLKAYGHVHPTDPTAEDTHEHTEELPEVNDEFAKSFGGFENLADLKEKIKENIALEKERDNKDAYRVEILEAISNETKLEIPPVLIESEQEKMLAQIEADITRAGMTLDDYLKQTNKTKEDIKKEYQGEAEKRAKMQLILHSISRAEKITIPEDELKTETDKLMTMYPGANRERTEAYAEMVLTNEKVLKLLETK